MDQQEVAERMSRLGMALIACLMSLAILASCGKLPKEDKRSPLPSDKPTSHSTSRKSYKVVGKHRVDGVNTLIYQDVEGKNSPVVMQNVINPVYQGCQVGEIFDIRKDGTPSCGVGN